MKNQPFFTRLRFAATGFKAAFSSEASFRAQVFFAGLMLVFLLISQPAPIWWALVALTASAVLAAELVNTSLESVIDRLHPEQHPAMARAKDCAAAAVLLLSCAALAVFLALSWELILRP